MPAELEAPAAPAAPSAPAKPAAAPSAPAAPEAPQGGAQGARPAPAGTIPAKLQAFSDRPESAKSKAMERLRQKVAGNEPKPQEKPKPEPKPEPGADEYDQDPEDATPAAEPEDPEGDDLLSTPKVKEAPKVDKPPVDKGEKKKVNPWKLIDEHKAAVATKEKEIAELRKMIGDPEARKSEVAELERLKAANKELLDKIRYVEYQSHPEFTEKYEAPYKESWKAAMKNVRGLTVANEDGTGGREITAQDMLELVMKSGVQARKAANELFGEFADDVMRERDKIRTAFDNRESALERAKTEGSQKVESEKKARFEAMQSLSAKVKSEYDSANEKFSKRRDMAEFFQDLDGDDDANDMLRKGYALVDEAFTKDVMSEGLTDAERASIVKKHAAVRHRAAAFGRARYLLAKERAEHALTKAKLAEFQSTVPNRGASPNPTVQQANMGGSKMQQMLGRLRQKAKTS